MSQEELGQKLLVSRQTISLWEKDQTVPTIDNLIRLREIFGVSVDEILGFETIEQNNEILPNNCIGSPFQRKNQVKYTAYKEKVFIILIQFVLIVVSLFYIVFKPFKRIKRCI